jgi:hypothetical protein
MSSFTTTNTLNEADLAKKWSNKRANQITDKAYSFEDAGMFADHIEGELYNVCFDLESANISNAVLEGTMRSMQKELAELREFKEVTENTLALSPHITSVFNREQKKIKSAENEATKSYPKCVQQRFGNAPHSRRACTKNSKFKGFYSGM